LISVWIPGLRTGDKQQYYSTLPMRQVGLTTPEPRFPDRLLAQLDARRYSYDPGQAAHILKILTSLGAARFADARSLIRFHELLLFLRAFPHSPGIVRKTEKLLNTFHERVEALRQTGADMSDFEQMEACGIAGTRMEDTLSFDVANWVTRRLPGQVEIAWDHYDPGRELGTAGPRFMPLLEDDSYVEADTPWRRWLETAAGKKDCDPAWLIQRFANSPLPPNQRAELYESLRVPLRWHLENSRVARTRNWKAVRSIFCHSGPLIRRSEVSLAMELAKRPPRFTRLSRRQGEAVIETIREVMLVRYRELYGTSLADPSSVVRADVGRGVSIYLWSLPPERRLPLRAYVAGLTLKNGVPLNYIEAIGLCEWMEVGFNTFYTFRGGEAGWVYAQVLRCLCCLLGTTCVSVYPYQLGQDNDEALESGAFWFYRKLGFRCGREDLERLAEREEQRIAANRNYRTPARVLKRLAAGHVFYELPGSEVGDWDRFSTRNIGLRVNQRMARHFSGDSKRIRQESFRTTARILAVNPSSWTNLEQTSFENFAVVLALVPGLSAWTDAQKQTLQQIIRAKSKPDEMQYLHLTQRHGRLREALLKLGS
jgi:hypothetical protein